MCAGPAHLPFPCGIVLGALWALLPPPGALGSGTVGRAFVRRPLLGRSLLRGSVFRPFSWRALLVILTPESCREKRKSGELLFSRPYTRWERPQKSPTERAWGRYYNQLLHVFVRTQTHVEAIGDPWCLPQLPFTLFWGARSELGWLLGKSQGSTCLLLGIDITNLCCQPSLKKKKKIQAVKRGQAWSSV